MVSAVFSGSPFVAALDRLGQQQIDPVTREDEAGNTGLLADGNRYGAHARAQGRSQEAAVAGGNQCALGNRLAGSDGEADNRAQQFGDVGLAFKEIGVLHHFLGPGLERDRISRDDRADRQGALGDQCFGPLRHSLSGLGLGRGSACEQASCSERRADRNDQRSQQQHQLLLIHG